MPGPLFSVTVRNAPERPGQGRQCNAVQPPGSAALLALSLGTLRKGCLPMALRPCSACSLRVAGKLSSVYWSWNLADKSRVCWLQRLCVSCFVVRVLPLLTAEVGQAILCPGCTGPSDEDMDPVYAKVYVPGHPEQGLELPYCPRCAVAVRAEAIVGSERLPDRNPQFGGQAPELTAADVWASLGKA